jgi:hypothetical protein
MVTVNPKKSQQYLCDICEYITDNKKDYVKHLGTSKHLKLTLANTNGDAKIPKHCCSICNKKYESRNGLWKHSKNCKYENNNDEILDKEQLIIMLIKQNSELIKESIDFKSIVLEQQNKMFEQQNIVLELIKKDSISNSTVSNSTVSNNTINSNNNTFNLQFFLNETCKDALNIGEFVDSIKVQLTDLEHTGRTGYVEGVSKILIKNLNELDTCKRPIHCSDVKREVLYIKDDDKWLKENDDKLVIKKVIKDVANKNIKQITEWANLNPDCKQFDSRKNDQYLKIVMNSMSGGSNEEQTMNINKIIKNITKSVIIEK